MNGSLGAGAPMTGTQRYDHNNQPCAMPTSSVRAKQYEWDHAARTKWHGRGGAFL